MVNCAGGMNFKGGVGIGDPNETREAKIINFVTNLLKNDLICSILFNKTKDP
jgi:hypothetical protein